MRKEYSVFAPAAIAAIGTLPLPLLHRSLDIRMNRTLRTDIKSLEAMEEEEEKRRLEGLRRYITNWSQTVTFDHDPRLPKILRGRTADIWRVLLSIADSFGSPHWSEVARKAAVTFAGAYRDEDAAVALLYDIQTIFRRLNVDRIKSSILTKELVDLEDGVGVWGSWCGPNDDQSPHALNQSEIATLLRRFDRNLRPQPLFDLGSRDTRGPAGRGYYKKAFERWFAIYCPEKVDDADNVRQLHQKGSE